MLKWVLNGVSVGFSKRRRIRQQNAKLMPGFLPHIITRQHTERGIVQPFLPACISVCRTLVLYVKGINIVKRFRLSDSSQFRPISAPRTLQNSQESQPAMAINLWGGKSLRFSTEYSVNLGNGTRYKGQVAARSMSVPTTSSDLERRDARRRFFFCGFPYVRPYELTQSAQILQGNTYGEGRLSGVSHTKITGDGTYVSKIFGTLYQLSYHSTWHGNVGEVRDYRGQPPHLKEHSPCVSKIFRTPLQHTATKFCIYMMIKVDMRKILHGRQFPSPGETFVTQMQTRDLSVMALLQLRFEYDSSAIRARIEHSMLQHATRFFVRSHTSPIRAPYENRVEVCHTVD